MQPDFVKQFWRKIGSLVTAFNSKFFYSYSFCYCMFVSDIGWNSKCLFMCYLVIPTLGSIHYLYIVEYSCFVLTLKTQVM